VNKEYVCSVKKGHLFSGSASDQAPPQCCGKPMILLSAEPRESEAPITQPKSSAAAAESSDQAKKRK